MQRLLTWLTPALVIVSACQGSSNSAGNAPAQSSTKSSTESSGPGQASSQDPSATAPAQEGDAVRKAFDRYKSALLERRGQEAATLVDSTTLDFYAKCAKLALTAPKDTLSKEGIVVRMTTLMLRQRVPGEKLAAMDAKQIVAHAVDNGWIGSNLGDLNLAEITVAGNTARAQVAGQPASVAFVFHRQDGAWKIDLTALFAYAERGLKQAIAQMGMDENQGLVEMLGRMTGGPVPETIWEPTGQSR